MRIFLSGPMRGKPNYNYAEFFRVAADLRAAGHEVVSPAEHDIEVCDGTDPARYGEAWVGCSVHNFHHHRPCQAMRDGRLAGCEVVLLPAFDLETAFAWCLEALEECDAIYLMDGWEQSEGAVKEWQAALRLSKEVFVDGYAPARELLEGPEPWPEGGVSTWEADGEERVVNEATGGEKGRKLARFDLLPAHPLRQVAEHYGIGAQKYEDRNWERGYDWSLSYGALQRHANAFWSGETYDPETGSHHMAAVVFHALALMEFEDTHPELDDRPRASEDDRATFLGVPIVTDPSVPDPNTVYLINDGLVVIDEVTPADEVFEAIFSWLSGGEPEPEPDLEPACGPCDCTDCKPSQPMRVLADGDSGLGYRPNAPRCYLGQPDCDCKGSYERRRATQLEAERKAKLAAEGDRSWDVV